MFMKCGGARYRKDGHIVRRLVFTQVCICYDIRQRLLQDPAIGSWILPAV